MLRLLRSKGWWHQLQKRRTDGGTAAPFGPPSVDGVGGSFFRLPRRSPQLISKVARQRLHRANPGEPTTVRSRFMQSGQSGAGFSITALALLLLAAPTASLHNISKG
jgi:hypothetical protein